MVEASVYKDRLNIFYEVYRDTQNSATSPIITITGKLPHADVVASSGWKLELTQVHVNGVRANITQVAANGADTDIMVSDTIVSGDNVDILLATSTGTLANNTLTGKFPMVEVQALQKYSVASNKFNQVQCGSGRQENRRFEAAGEALLGIIRRGNKNLKNFVTARKNGTNLMILVKDSANSDIVYDILHEVRVKKYQRLTQAINTEAGVITDVIKFRFTSQIDTRSGIVQHATSFDDATLSGAPLIIKLQLPDDTYTYTKVYPTASATTGEVTDPISSDVKAINDATLSGVPTLIEIVSGEHGCLLKTYPTISAEVEAHAGILLYPEAFLDATISGNPRILTIPINSTTYYTKGYPNKV